MKAPCVVIGGGLSGLAAAIRLARFIPDVVLLEQHTRIGGLNSYYYRNKSLFETGLHAITNYAEKGDKRAPLNRLFRQLKLKRNDFSFLQQKTSEIFFADRQQILFSNDFSLLQEEIEKKFPHSLDGFSRLCLFLEEFDPFRPTGFRSARSFLLEYLKDALLVDMLLCPLMYYGSSVENDMDLSQFAIMFQAIYKEGMFRPEGTIKEFLDMLSDYFTQLGGSIRLGCRVRSLATTSDTVTEIRLDSGEILEPQFILSTIGHKETLALLGSHDKESESSRLGFIESIFQLPSKSTSELPANRTVIFFNTAPKFSYQQPQDLVDYSSGVICLPFNFVNLQTGDFIEVRSTHLASYHRWKSLQENPETYFEEKRKCCLRSRSVIEEIVGKFEQNIVYEDSFTPLTIERYTSKMEGAIYGSPQKIKDGDLGYSNLFLAGTDQGFLGIVGSMLSGVSIVNQHILPRF